MAGHKKVIISTTATNSDRVIRQKATTNYNELTTLPSSTSKFATTLGGGQSTKDNTLHFQKESVFAATNLLNSTNISQNLTENNILEITKKPRSSFKVGIDSEKSASNYRVDRGTRHNSNIHLSLFYLLIGLILLMESPLKTVQAQDAGLGGTENIANVQSQNTYLITGPRVIRPSGRYDLSVQILDSAATTLEASIVALADDNTMDDNPPIIILPRVDDSIDSENALEPKKRPNFSVIARAEGTFTPGSAQILAIQIPPNLTAYSNRRLALRVNVLKGGTSSQLPGVGSTSPLHNLTQNSALKFGIPRRPIIITPFPNLRNETDLSYSDKVRSILIQTDKAKYKPGDLVQFRVIVIEPTLKPSHGSVTVYISDPQDNRIKQLLARSLTRGFFKADLQLADKTLLGDWKISAGFIPINDSTTNTNVNNNQPSTDKTFTVEEYVLPVWDIKLFAPSYGVLDRVRKLVKVVGYFEAKFTFGGNVPGQATIVLKDTFGEYNSTLRIVQYTQTQLVQEIDSDSASAKHDFEITIDYNENARYNQDSFTFGHSYTLTLTFVDNLTLNSKTTSQNIQFYTFPYELILVGPTYYKPGLAINLRVTATLPDGKPLDPATDLPQLLEMLKSLQKTDDLKSSKADSITFGHHNSASKNSNDQPITLSNFIELKRNLHYSYPFYLNPDTYTVDLTKTQLFGLDPLTGQKTLTFTDIDKKIDRIGFEANFRGLTRTFSHTANRFDEPAGIYMELRNTDPNFNNSNILKLGTKHTVEAHASVLMTNLTAIFTAKGKIVGVKSINIKEPAKRIEISFPVVVALAPTFRVLAYFVTQAGNVIVDSIEFRVDRFTENFVNLEFKPAGNSSPITGPISTTQNFLNASTNGTILTLKPRDQTNLIIKTRPNALIGLLAVDQSVRILATGNDITSDTIQNELSSFDASGNPSPYFGNFFRGRLFIYPPFGQSGNALQIFKNAGLVVLTDAKIHQGEIFTSRFAFGARANFGGGAAPEAMAAFAAPPAQFMLDRSSDALAKVESAIVTRTEFPETWIWEDVTADSSGMAQLTKGVPDTITTWVATALSMDDDKGLAVSDTPAEIRVFQPFFVTLNLPYSVIRGEKVKLQALVYNYLGRDISAIVKLEPPEKPINADETSDFEILSSDQFLNQISPTNAVSQDPQSTNINLEQNVAIKNNAIFPVIFYIRPLRVGPLRLKVKVVSEVAGDAIEKLLPVKAEGETLYFNQPYLINLNAEMPSFSESFMIPWDIGNFIPLSNRLEVSVIGDIMGPSLTNLGGLVRLPSGCGEQNMLNFAPNLYIYDYLRTKGLLTEQLKNQIVAFTERGYQRQLTYQRADGSFSAFGRSDKSGSVWLTAFVLRSFIQARQLIYIEPRVIENALLFLLEQQKLPPLPGSLNPFKGNPRDIGSFVEIGEIHHKPLQGGSSKGLALTAYVYVSLRETMNAFFSVNTTATSTGSAFSSPKLMGRLASAILFAEAYMIDRLGPVLDFASKNDLKNTTISLPISTYDLAITTYALTVASLSPLPSSSFDYNLKFSNIPVSNNNLNSGDNVIRKRSPTTIKDELTRIEEIREGAINPIPSEANGSTNPNSEVRESRDIETPDLSFKTYLSSTFNTTNFNIVPIVINANTNQTEVVTISNLNIATHNERVKAFAATLLQILLSQGVNERGTTFWRQKDLFDLQNRQAVCNNVNTAVCNIIQPPSLDFETTAYVLLSLASLGGDDRIKQGLPVLNWLVRHRSAIGGFSSTQDTIVSLNALTKFASLLPPVSQQNLQINIQGNTNSYDVSLKADNVLVKNVFDFGTKLEKEITLTANGSGTALAQISWSYNVKSDKASNRGFDLDVIARPRNKTLLLNICMRYTIGGNASEAEDLTGGSLGRSNMVVLEINAPSGYLISRDSVIPLTSGGSAPSFPIATSSSGPPRVKTFELLDGNTKLNLYFDSLGSVRQCIDLSLDQLYEVADLKPALVKLSDYYQPEYKQTAYIEFQTL